MTKHFRATHNTTKEVIELWNDIPGYEGHYQASTRGQIKSISRNVIAKGNSLSRRKERILKPKKHRLGYLEVVLCKDSRKKTLRVHRLVVLAFLPNPLNKPHVNHKNSIKSDNYLDNLEWCTRVENQQHALSNGRYAHQRIQPQGRMV